ncbi:TolC family protein [Chitinophaga oryziterrae]|uniref:TolC family protein n=1 Tax=Chitinophaga oryziterrae TaxID=1031224 RepID=A0A6N8JEA7_9BACT|nr:TolC family protein [Chitinophaga oryziterrae]MVT43547.1 TolC family protein [Chitinophaga oryziterrae]
MNTTKYFVRLVMFLLMGTNGLLSTALAQENTRNISLTEAVSAALVNNGDLHQALLDERIAASDYKQTQAIFLPKVDVSYTAMSTNNPLNAFGFKLQQRTITQDDFNPAFLNHPSATPDYMAKLEVLQPLINMDMLYQRKGAEKQTEVYQYKTQHTKEYLTFEVQKAYLQLQLAYTAVSVLEDALRITKDVYTYTDNHFKQGLIQKSDALNAQVQVATLTSNLAKANSNIRNASDYLSLLMGEKSGTVYKTTDSITAAQQLPALPQNVASSRADFMAMQKAIEASDLMIKSNRMSYLPKLNAFGNYQYNDSRLTGFAANAYLVGVQLSWNIFNGNRTKNRITTQKLERDKLVTQLAVQKDQSQLELDKAYRDLADAQSEIRRGNAAIEQASEALRILQNRYEQGLVNTTDVLLAQTQLSQQRFSLAQAQFTANVTLAYLQFLTTGTNK